MTRAPKTTPTQPTQFRTSPTPDVLPPYALEPLPSETRASDTPVHPPAGTHRTGLNFVAQRWAAHEISVAGGSADARSDHGADVSRGERINRQFSDKGMLSR